MTEATARAIIKAHFDASNVGVAGGGPDDDIVRASEIYADDAVVEWPQGGERLRGKANIIGFRASYPTRQQFELHRTTGCHDLWVNEYTIRYDDQPVVAVGIMEFRDGKVVRERIYFGDSWEPPDWRARWRERDAPPRPGRERHAVERASLHVDAHAADPTGQGADGDVCERGHAGCTAERARVRQLGCEHDAAGVLPVGLLRRTASRTDESDDR